MLGRSGRRRRRDRRRSRQRPPSRADLSGPRAALVAGPVGDFGAPRDGGRTHEGYDIVAACGTKLVSAREGKVLKRAFDPVLYGNYVYRPRARDGPQLLVRAYAQAGDRQGRRAGADRQRIGSVGKTGNARTVGCHLHFEIHVHGLPSIPSRRCGAGTVSVKSQFGKAAPICRYSHGPGVMSPAVIRDPIWPASLPV